MPRCAVVHSEICIRTTAVTVCYQQWSDICECQLLYIFVCVSDSLNVCDHFNELSDILQEIF